MPFCPHCRSEYTKFSKRTDCIDCSVRLVSQLETNEILSDMGDVYICYEPFHAQRVADILRSEGIETLVRDRSSSPFPTNIGMTSEQHVAVVQNRLNDAHNIIERAFIDKVIPIKGLLLPK